MNKAKVIASVKRLVKERLSDGEPGHDYWHCYRVVQNALAIGRKEKADLLVLELAGWLARYRH